MRLNSKRKRSILLQGSSRRYPKLHKGISNEALKVLMQDNEEFGSDTVFSLAALHPVVSGGGSKSLNSKHVMMFL